MTSFPEGWFLIKNLNNGYVLSIEKSSVGEPIVISSIRKDIDSQLWQYDEDKRLHNKKTGFVLDVAKAKSGTNIVLQNDTKSADGQNFGISADGHIHLLKNPKLVLGIKDSFFSRSEGQAVHLQSLDKHHKEQRWEVVVPSKRHSLGSVLSGSVSSLKRTISGASLGSSTSLHLPHDQEDSCLDESAHVQTDKFPEGEFFIKSELTGHFVSTGMDGSSSKLSLEPLRTSNYESQLWQYDPVTHRLINKGSGFALSADQLTDEALVSQSNSTDLKAQAWTLGASGAIRLKSNPQFLLGFKKDNWFNLNREVAHVLIQKADHRVHSYQKFVLALPIFKKKTTEIVSATAQIGVFPEGYFFIKNQKHGLVVSVLETEKLAAYVVASPLDSQNYNRQLWTYKDGFLINKASQFVLDVRGGCIVNGTELCQYKQKKVGYENQQWGLTVEGYIHAKTHESMVLALDKNLGEKPTLALAHKKTPDHEEQRWNFVLPVFKHKSSSVTEKTVQKSIVYHRYAQYPSGWFFIRSFVGQDLVLTANESDSSLFLVKISKEQWRYQLWMHWNGILINFATQLAINISDVAVGSTIHQELRQESAVSQKWSLTTEGYLVHGSNSGLSLIPEAVESGYKLTLVEQDSVKQEHRWGLLAPETKVENGLQILSNWKSILLSECKKVNGKYTQKIIHRFAHWPEDTFYISAQDGYALVPEKLESYSTVVVKKLEFGHYEQFRWSFRDGYLVHVATGLVLHASDELVGGSELQIRERLVDDHRVDERQIWAVKTDGSIVAETKSNLGFALLKQNNTYHVQLAYATAESEHYTWGFVHGHYETRYSNVYKKEMTVLTRLERILLIVRQSQVASDKTKLVTRSYGVFPEHWFYIRSKADNSLVLTAPDKKQGSKLTLSKLDFASFRRQLWRVEDNDCLINLDSGFVIDIAGGALNAGCDAIQWHQKFLKIQRKNQTWGLSVDGHIHPKSRPGLVLGPKGNSASEGTEIQLHTRGSLDLEYQRWTFAIPVFGRPGGMTSVGVLEGNHSDVFVNSMNDNSIETASAERYERTEKITIVRRWGMFPKDGFFIRSSYGERLALSVEKNSKVEGLVEYTVTLKPIDFKEYQWHFWTYEDGHLINKQTGLALDASPVKGALLEDGLQSSLFVRERSMSSHQFWSLTATGEVHLRSDQRLIVGVSSASRVSVPNAQVGLRPVHVQKTINEKGQQEITHKSQSWLQWSFSKPVFGTRKSSTATEETSTSIEEEIQSLSDETLEVKEAEESSEDIETEDESDSDSEEEDDDKEDTSSLDKLNLVGNLGIATAGANILANTIKPTIEVTPEASTNTTSGKATPDKPSSGVVDNKQHDVLKAGVTKKTAYFSQEDSFHLSYDYTPTGYEKVIRYLSHQKPLFPHEGYFMIKSYLHGYVLDVANNEARDGSYIVLAPIKSTNFASQLWSYRGGRLVNLKSHNLVLDASLNDTVAAGERVGLSTQKTAVGVSDQHWEFDLESGVIHLAGKRSLILAVKELTPATETTGRIDLFIQEEKSHEKSKFARAEQRWEIKIPALVPVDRSKDGSLTSSYTIVEGGKVSAISSSLSTVLAFEWFKSTFQHVMYSDNQWPSIENFFFVRLGAENAYLCSGASVHENVTFASIEQKEDYKRYLWAYVDGYLVNYKYMLRLVFNNENSKLSLSSSAETLNQMFSITNKGALSLKIDSQVIHFSTTKDTSGYHLGVSEDSVSSQYPLQLHIPVYSNHQIEKEANVALSTITTWIHTSQRVTTSITRTYRYGLFPASTWFFIKASGTKEGESSLVLAVKDNALVLKKLSFKDYKSQLWAFRDDALVNYGSKLVMDVSEGAINHAVVKISSEAGVGTQKWSLTTEGHIYLDSYSGFKIGLQSSSLEEDAQVVLVDASEQAITWSFSVPVFGKKLVESNANMSTTVESLTSSIEEGVMIETLEHVKFKVEEVFAKKVKNQANEEGHHNAHDILTNVGIITGAVVAGTAVVGAAAKVMDKLTEEKKVLKKNTESVFVRRSKKSSVQVVQESQAIVRAWKIVFIRRIHLCSTQTQLIETVEESREELFRRLDEHLRVYTSVEHIVSGSLPQWHVSIEQVKELYRARVFERFLDRLQHTQVQSAAELDFDAVIASATEEVDCHYESVIEEQKKAQIEVSVDENSTESTEAHEHILLTVDTIKVKVRYWLIELYETISVAQKDGKSEEEIHHLVETAHQELTSQLTEIKTIAISHVEKTTVKKSSIINTIEKALVQTEAVVSKQVDAIRSEKHYQVNQDYWLEVTRTSEERLSSELKVYQTAITQEVTEVQNNQTSSPDQAQIAVVLDEKMVSVAQETITAKLLETKTKLTSWFSQITQQITWVLESSDSIESVKQDSLAIVDAAQIELAARVEETKLVLRTYYAHLTYLSWAERRRIDYALDNIRVSLVANMVHFKRSIENQGITKEEIIRFSEYSFGATVSRMVLLDVDTIVSKISNVKESVTVVNTTETKNAEANKVVAITEGKSAQVDATEVQETQKNEKADQVTKAEASKVKVDQAAQAETSKAKVDQVAQAETSKIEKTKPSKTAIATMGAAAAAMASAAIYHHHEDKKAQKAKQNAVPSSTQEAIVDLHKTTKQQKSDSVVTVYDQVHVTIEEWMVQLNKRVLECVQRKPDNVQEEINQIVYESQQELVVSIEKAKRTTTSVIGTSQTSFHETLAWVRRTVWTQTTEVKRLALEVTDTSVLEERLASVKESTLSKVSTEIDKCKTSSATIAVGQKFEGVDYSKKTHGAYVEATKVSVGVLIEETRATVQEKLNDLAVSIAERRKQGGDRVQEDIKAIVQKSRQEISNHIKQSKTEFEKRVTHTDKNELLVKETNEKVQVTLDQVEESVFVQVSKVEQEQDYEKVTTVCQEAYKHVDATLTVSETIIGHHIEVVAESEERPHESKKVSLGVEYGLVVVAETVRSCSAQLTKLIERVHSQTTEQKDTFETVISESNVQIDRVFDEAKTKIGYELSMVASHEKVQEEHFFAVLEEMHTAAKKRVIQVQEVVLSKKETTTERLLQIAEEARHEVSGHFESLKNSVTQGTDKLKDSVHQDMTHTEKEEDDHESKVNEAKKVLAISATVAAGTAIAVEVAKKVSAHKEKVEQEEKIKQERATVVEDVKVQFSQWISTLTETVAVQSKQSVSQEEITVTIEKSKKEFLEVVQKTKTNTVVNEDYQQEILTWIEQTVESQASRIQEIVTGSSTVVDVESRLEVLKISTKQEVEKALKKIKDIKSSTVKFTGSTVDQLKQKESALLDVKSELSLVVHDVRTSVTTFFEKFSTSVVTRVQQGGENVSKDVAILVADGRKELSTHIEQVKGTATKKLSDLETKSTVSVISVAALSGVATAELISVLKKTEDILLERIDRIHSTVWYIEKDQDMTEVVQTITKIQTETITEVNEKIDRAHYGFVTGIVEHQQEGHIAEKIEHHDENTLKASLTIQEVKVTIREWLRIVAEKVSDCSQKGQSSEEIEVVIRQETTRIFEYLDLSATKISDHLKSEEKTQDLHATVKKIKSILTKSTTEIKKIGVEYSGKSTGYGGYGQMTSVINEHEHLVSQVLVVYETKSVKSVKKEEVKESVKETKKVDTQTVVVVEYIITTIHTWLEDLMVEVSEVSKREHDITKVTEQINEVLGDAKEFITLELDTISKKVQQSKAASELVNIIEWTRGMVLQSTTQIQQIGVNSAVSFSSTGGIDQMRPLIGATEAQIKVALERCNKSIKIDIERKSSYCDKHNDKKECRKQERKKSDCDKKLKEEKKKKAECEKKDKEERKKAEKKAKEERKKTEKKDKEERKKAQKDEKKDETESESDTDDSGSDSDHSDSETYLKKAKKDIQKIVASGAVLSVSIIVREWYEQLIVDVSTRAKRGGSHSDSDIETIVKKATLTITEKLRLLGENSHKSLVDVQTVEQYRQSIEWAKNLVIQSSLQIQSIAVSSAVSATSKTGGIEQMRPIAVSIQQQIDVETRRYKLVDDKKKSAVTKVESKPVTEVEHKKNTEKVSTGKTSIVARKEHCEKLQTQVTEVISESKLAVIAWYSQVIREVSIRVHQGGANVKGDVGVIIEKSKLHLDETLKRTHKKFVTSVDVNEQDEFFSTIETQIKQSFDIVQKSAEKKVIEVQEITVKYQSESEVTEKLSGVLESSKLQVTETLDTTCKQTITIIEEETIQTKSTATVIETVDYVKSVVISWQTKLSEEIYAISIDQDIENKEEKIDLLIQEANTDIERVTQEAKTKISESCQSVKKISKSKKNELLTTIDYAHETFIVDIKKVQQVSIESIKKSENVKDSISSVFESSRSKIDSFFTRTAAIIVSTVAINTVSKKDKNEKPKKDNDFSLSAHENVKAISQWFELFTQRISSSVHKQEGNVVEHVTLASEQAEHEISEIISAARTEFVKRLSHENMDQETYDVAIKHYEEGLEAARVSILLEVTEVKKVAIESHKSGKVQLLDVELQKLVTESTERIKVAIGSSVSITQKTQTGNDTGSAFHIEVEEDKQVVSDQEVEVEHKEESVEVSHEDKAKKEKHGSNLEKIVAGSLAVGAAAGAAVLVHEKHKKDQKKEATFVKYETGVAAIENVHVTISEWFKTLVQKVSHASKSGASSAQITVIVQESRTELTQFIDHAKAAGAAHCISASDEQQFVSKIEWVSSVAHAQAVQIQQIGINATVSKSDLTSQMESLATASFHQIEVTLEQMKTTINFHQKINKISGKASKSQKVTKPIKASTAVEKTKAAYGVIQETRVATVALFVSLSESIVARIRQGGSHVEEDIHKIVETAEQEVVKIFEKSKRTEVDEKTRREIDVALTTVHKNVEEQITQVKTVTVKAVCSTTTSAEDTIEKVLEVSKKSKGEIEGGFTSVSETITASLVVVSQTAQNATKTVQTWFSDLSEKINTLLDASDCSAEETQKKINTVVTEAEADMKVKITKIQQDTVFEKKSTEISADHHLDVFFGNIKSSVEKQLNDVKTAVQDKSKMNKIVMSEVLKSSEIKLKQEVETHYEAVQQITNVEHITGTEQQVAAQVENNRHGIYKDTIEKVAVGTAAVAAAAATAIGFHKKNQKAETTSVEVIEESSIQIIEVKVNTWLSTLTERIITRTKQGGQQVSADVTEIVKSAQGELEAIIDQFKAEHKSENETESRRTFTYTLEWIKTTVITQSTQITDIVSHSSSSSIDLVTQIENHVSVTKQQITSAFETHKRTKASTVVKSEEKVNLSQQDTSVKVVSDQTRHENVVQVITETREQTQKRISLETTVIVQERKTEITNWLVLLMESLTTIIHSHSEAIKGDIFSRLELAEKEVETYVQDTKQRFLTITSSSVTNQVDIETQKLAATSIKQSLDCIENIRATLIIQISVIREVINSIEVEDIDVITERLHAVIDRTQQRVHHTLDVGIELAITSAFEGKVVVWTETAIIPQSFKNVRTIAYDLAGTVINYRKSLYQVWKRIVTPKNDIVLSTMDFNAFVNDWFSAYTEIKKENYAQRRPVSDDITLHEALVQILKRFYVQDSLTQAETEELCESWRKVGTYEDASIGIRRIKSQDAKYATIAISDTFSTRTMVELAQSNCLCWHAQFSYDMFAATTNASESLVQGTIQLLGLAHASELAIVSANAQLVSAAKKHGCHAVLIERESQQTSGTYDVKVDGLDVFGESVQSFLEHNSMVKSWDDKDAPSAPTVWAQKVKSLFR